MIEIGTAVEVLYEEWKALWRRGTGAPFLHPAWHAAFVQANRDTVDSFLIGVRAEGQLVALLPMRRDRDGVLRFLTFPRSDYEDVLIADGREDALRELADLLLTERFELAELPEGSALATMLRARGARARRSSPCPGIRLTSETVADVTGRKSLRRHERKLARRGFVSLELVPRHDRQQELNRLIDQHVSRWLAVGHDSLFLDPANREFYRRLVTHPDIDEFASFHVLKVGEETAAYHLGLKSPSTFIWYKPTFDINIQKEGPGEVLFKTLVEEAYRHHGSGYFDFSRGAEAFKLRFANEQHWNTHIYHRRDTVARLTNVAGRRWRKMVQRAGSAMHAIAPGRVKKPRESQPFPVDPPPARPDPPAGFVFQFGKVDLVGFGALRVFRPDYITAERMKQAMEAQRRGDYLLIVRRAVDACPVHFSWYRIEPSAPGGEEFDSGGLERVGRIFDPWTAPEAYGQGIFAWALKYMAWQANQQGVHVQSSGIDGDPLSNGLRRAG